MADAPTTAGHARIGALDGLRGIAIILVVLSHGWALWPTDHLTRIRPFDGLFYSGSLAVTLFFVIGGFVVTRGLLMQADGSGVPNPLRFYARRFVRLGVQLYPLLVVVLIVNSLDHSDPYGAAPTRDSVLAVGSYTWNWYLMGHVFTARSDLGHLWYLSVEQQFYVVLALVVALLARYRRSSMIALVALVIACVMWRAHVLDVEGSWRASLRTTTRMDGLLLGVFAALAVTRLQALRRVASPLLWLSGLAMLCLILVSSAKGNLDYLKGQGLAFDIAAAVFIIAIYLAPPRSELVRALSVSPIRLLGTWTLAIYVWHYPLFWFVARHTHHWSWVARTAVAFGVLAAIVAATDLLIERPTKRWLTSHLRLERRGKDAEASALVDQPV